MQEIEFQTLDGQILSLTVNAEFVDSTRQHTLGEGTPTSYVVAMTDVFDQSVDTSERCVVVVFPELVSEAIDLSAARINEQVRTTLEGTPVACALFANGRVAVNAQALNEAQPMKSGRLTVLWVFRDNVALYHHPYDEDTEEKLWLASSIADGHRHETGWNAETAGTDPDSGVIEVLACFNVVETEG